MAKVMRCRCCGEQTAKLVCQWCQNECGSGRDGCTKTFFEPVEA